VLLEYFQNDFLTNLSVVDRRLNGRKFWGNFEPLPGVGNVVAFTSFQDFGKLGSRRQWLNKCVTCTNGLLGRCLRHLPSIPHAFLNFKEFINFCKSHGLILWGRLLSTSSSRAWTLYPPPTIHGFHHADHVVWTEFLNSQQLCWLSRMHEI
jgi:hypothetical protein